MKRYSLLMIVCFLFTSCINELDEIATPTNQQPDPLNLTDGVIIGEKLQNPYSLEVMKRACDLLYPPTRGEDPVSDSLIVPNVKYVRFLPADSTEFRLLSESKLELFNYPLDYDILGDPSDYHDPSVPPEQITWQYTVMPIEQAPPISNVEVLGVGFIPEANDPNSIYDLAAIEKTANGLVINTQKKEPTLGTHVGSAVVTTPANQDPDNGRILIYNTSDTIPTGVKGIKVRARHYWKIRTAYTNAKGEYDINLGDFVDVHPRFELRFENKYGFKIGYGTQLVMPMSTNMGNDMYPVYRSDYGHKTWVACTINNAAYDWYERCEDEGMPTPPSDLYIWAMEMSLGAACPMLHHGTYNTAGLSIVPLATFLFGSNFGLISNAALTILINIIAPDVFIFDVDKNDTSTLYEYTSHELSHATHFQQLGEDVIDRALWWANVINYEISCGVLSKGDNPYEHPSVPRSEMAGITEMWAHAVGHICKYEYRNKAVGGFLYNYWFKPEIILELYRNGMTLQEISQSMQEDIDTLQSFKDQLIEDNESYASLINQVFQDHLNL